MLGFSQLYTCTDGNVYLLDISKCITKHLTSFVSPVRAIAYTLLMTPPLSKKIDEGGILSKFFKNFDIGIVHLPTPPTSPTRLTRVLCMCVCVCACVRESERARERERERERER